MLQQSTQTLCSYLIFLCYSCMFVTLLHHWVFLIIIIFDWILYFFTRKVTALGFDPRILIFTGSSKVFNCEMMTLKYNNFLKY